MLERLVYSLMNRHARAADITALLVRLGDIRGNTLCDIGAGGGYFSFLFSDLVGGNGKVYSLDTSKHSIDYIEKRKAERRTPNIQCILVNGYEMPIPEKTVDICFSRNAYHHFEDPVGYFTALKKYLKADGRAVILDYRKTGKLNFVNVFGHYSDGNTIIENMKASGYRLLESAETVDSTLNVFRPGA